jgi:DedD protein
VLAAPAAAAANAPAGKNTFAPIAAKGGWSIQLGSFGNRANADKLVRKLRAKGIRVYVSSQSGKHRVRAGPFPDRATAERIGVRLKSQVQSVTIVAP